MVLFRSLGVAFDKQDAARRLAAVAQVPFYDAINVIGHHHGRILGEELEPGVAQRWSDELCGIGLPVVVLHASGYRGRRSSGTPCGSSTTMCM